MFSRTGCIFVGRPYVWVSCSVSGTVQDSWISLANELEGFVVSHPWMIERANAPCLCVRITSSRRIALSASTRKIY